MKNPRSFFPGQILVAILVATALALLLTAGLVSWALTTLKASKQALTYEQSLHLAEAGLEYYRFHLSRAPTDFQDGTGHPGPYVHELRDSQGQIFGQFTLTITPPPAGSTVTTLSAQGQIYGLTPTTRTVVSKVGIPSFAQYAAVGEEPLRIAEGTETFGPVHANQGLRFDGLAHNLVTSAVSTYQDPDHGGNEEFGVHTHSTPADPLPPANLPSRPDVFLVGRQFPVAEVNFSALTQNLNTLRTEAQLRGRYLGSSGAAGYHVLLKPDQTFDLYQVNTLLPVPNGCTNVRGQQTWGTWSIAPGEEQWLANYPMPGNGLLFLEDDVWVEGRIQGTRLTIVAAQLPDSPGQRKSITVNNNLLYTNYDGTDALALIGQRNVNIGMVSQNVLRIDAALVAQTGSVGRHYYRPPSGGSQRCAPYHTRESLTLYGMLATFEPNRFSYEDGTGYQSQHLIYDANLRFAPPPHFPLTNSRYTTISWQETH